MTLDSMIRENYYQRSSLLSFLFAALLFAGCGPNPDGMLAALNDSNIKRLANLYGVYQFQNDYKGPKDEAAFREFISAKNPEHLKRMGVDPSKLDDLFKSERDKQSFKIRWKVNTQARGSSDPVVFEAEGVEGVRLVAFTGGELVEADSSQFDRLWKGEGGITNNDQSYGGGPKKQ